MLGLSVVGEALVGDELVGEALVGDALVGEALVGDALVGELLVGTAVVGAADGVTTLMHSLAVSAQQHSRRASTVSPCAVQLRKDTSPSDVVSS